MLRSVCFLSRIQLDREERKAAFTRLMIAMVSPVFNLDFFWREVYREEYSRSMRRRSGRVKVNPMHGRDALKRGGFFRYGVRA